MTLRGVSHRQYVVGEESCLVPSRGQRDMASNGLLVLQHPNPREPIRIGPDRIEDAGEVDIHRTPSVFHQMRQDVTHLVVREGVLRREMKLVPTVRSGWLIEQLGAELGPRVRRGSTLTAHAARKHVQQVQGARDLPTPEIADGRRAPDVRRQAAASAGHGLPGLDYLLYGDAALGSGELGSILVILLEQQLDEALEGPRLLRVIGLEPVIPVDPVLEEVTVVHAALEYHLGPS